MSRAAQRSVRLAGLAAAALVVWTWTGAVERAFATGEGGQQSWLAGAGRPMFVWGRLLGAELAIAAAVGIAVWFLTSLGISSRFSLAAAGTVTIMFQPHLALGLPGHRAVCWVGLLVGARLVGGRGWAAGLGVAAAVGTLVVGRSPNGIFGVLPYVLAALLIEAAVSWRPVITSSAAPLAALGGVVVVLVGWITPVSHSLGGGVGWSDVWWSLRAVPLSAWARLGALNFAFGAGAGLAAWAAVSQWARERMPERRWSVPSGGSMRAALAGE